ncbi:MAG TPA: hypothetical protein VJ798_00745 [Rhizomicrobium sp.]|nr:hypothetical protein [Rhizomicrobium sp.]
MLRAIAFMQVKAMAAAAEFIPGIEHNGADLAAAAAGDGLGF